MDTGNYLRILVVDDEKLSSETTAYQLARAGHVAEAHTTPYSALAALHAGSWDVVLTDMRMPNMDGLQLLKEIKTLPHPPTVIFMTAHGTIKSAVEVMRQGAVDYLTKPFEFPELEVRLEIAAERKRMLAENAALREALGETRTSLGLVGRSPVMRRVYDLIEHFAGLPSNILLIGETGTGKELVARAIHRLSANSKGPFVAVGCANVPSGLAESELFGHEAGAFTGAVKRRLGRVELAAGGTLFLDDVDDLPLELQAKLLRVIQEKQFERVGGEKVLHAEVRFVAASKFDLQSLVAQGRFRQDLMYRLSVLTISLAPLRERRDDIPLLARHFLDEFARERNQEPKSLSAAAMKRLVEHKWPGNVRELRHAIEHALALSLTNCIEADELPPTLQPASSNKCHSLNLAGRDQLDLRAATEEFERELIRWALEKSDGKQGKAAAMLGIPRSTLQFKLGHD